MDKISKRMPNIPKTLNSQNSVTPKGTNKLKAGQSIHVLDVMNVDIAQPEKAIKIFTVPKHIQELTCDILVVGGSMGGVAAVLRATNISNLSIVLTEETDWLGGQMTSQGVSAFDENHHVEVSGACKSYQDFRKSLRNYYACNRKLNKQFKYKLAASDKYFSNSDLTYLNPGNCWVSWLAVEPKIALEILKSLLQPAITQNKLQILYRSKPIHVERAGKAIKSVTFVNLDSKGNDQFFKVRAKYILDATDIGELSSLCQLPYSIGSDSKADTKEPHAPDKGDCNNIQDFTYPFVLEFDSSKPQSDLEKPLHFDKFQQEKKFSLLGYKFFETASTTNSKGEPQNKLPFWEYRRLIDASIFSDSKYPHDLAMINWESNDLQDMDFIEVPLKEAAKHLAFGKALSLGFLYWLQNEAPRDDGGIGYKELKLRKDILGSNDGLSKYPYVRESRRMRTFTTVCEQDIARALQETTRAKLFKDSVGIGLYPIDIHGRQEVPGAAQASAPFQIPLGSLIPIDCKNLLASCKNLGVTHITNGAYRLHPIEWNIGESAGHTAVFAIKNKIKPDRILKDDQALKSLQKELVKSGTPIFWFCDLSPEHEAYAAIQYLSLRDIYPYNKNNLEAKPDLPATKADANYMFEKISKPISHKAKISKSTKLSSGSFTYDGLAESALETDDIKALKAAFKGLGKTKYNHTLDKKLPISKGDLAQWVYLNFNKWL